MATQPTQQILIVYASRYGQTGEIANRLAQWIQARGLHATVANVNEMPELSLENYEAVLIGSPVYMTHTDRALQRWVMAHRSALALKRTALFTVSLNAADDSAKAAKENQEILDGFAKTTDWNPDKRACFVGALMYRKYNAVVRFIMRRISAAKGGPVDTSHNHELTRWQDVESFAYECVQDWFGEFPMNRKEVIERETSKEPNTNYFLRR